VTVTGAALLLATGAAVGFLSGLTGIGGGVLMVPLLYAYYAASSTTAGVPAAAAHATSLFVIAPTAVFGAFRYGREKMVSWRVALPMGASAAVSAAFVALVAARIPDDGLRAGFALFLLVTAAHLARPPHRAADAEGEPAALGPVAAGGVAVGALSALLGVGGGVVAIPLLHAVARVPLGRLAATSLAVIAPAAAAGAVAYALAPAPQMPPWSVGLVDVGAGLPLLAGSLAMVGAGARANARVPEPALRIGFSALLAAAALRLLWGLFAGGA
jgi:uncharacterized membrane protein YfcA